MHEAKKACRWFRALLLAAWKRVIGDKLDGKTVMNEAWMMRAFGSLHVRDFKPIVARYRARPKVRALDLFKRIQAATLQKQPVVMVAITELHKRWCKVPIKDILTLNVPRVRVDLKHAVTPWNPRNKYVNAMEDANVAELIVDTFHTCDVYEVICEWVMKDFVANIPRLMEHYRQKKLTKQRSNTKTAKKYTRSELKSMVNVFALVKSESVQLQFPIWLTIRSGTIKLAAERNENVANVDILPSHQKSETALHIAKIIQKANDETRFGLAANIFEAALADRAALGFSDNASTGAVLYTSPIAGTYWRDDKIKMNMPPVFQALYHSWNMCFVTVMDLPNLVFAKLLFPTVHGAKPEDYIYPRAIALICAVNSSMIDTVQERAHYDAPTRIGTPYGSDPATVDVTWNKIHGSINLRMAMRVLGNVNEEEIRVGLTALLAKRRALGVMDFTRKFTRTLAEDPLKLTFRKDAYSAKEEEVKFGKNLVGQASSKKSNSPDKTKTWPF